MATLSTAAAHRTFPESQLPCGAWSETAGRALRKSYRSEGDADGWKLWRKHLAKRKLRSIQAVLGDRESALVWGLAESEIAESLLRLIGLLHAPSKTQADELAQAA